MDSACLPFGSLPGQNPLFVDFAHHFEKVRPFFHSPALTDPELSRRVDQARRSPGVPRKSFAAALTGYNQTLDPGPALVKNLQAFESPDCVAVVTGQQVALFGGPSYTVFKAATAIRLAQVLRRQGIRAVPVFWMASNDSDFEEIRRTYFVGKDARLISVEYPEIPADPCQMAGTVELASIEDCLAEVRSQVSDYPFAEPVLQEFEKDYRKDRTFRQAFACWISRLFRNHGLIVFDPLMEGYQDSLSSFYEIAVTRRASLVEALIRRNREIEQAGYQPQVWIDNQESLLFLADGSKRYKLLWEEGKYRAKERPELSFSKEELRALALEAPARLGVNVLLRPILQDYLFPTAYYVGGPAEVAYFAQLNAVAEQWDLEPVILPRAGFTIVNHRDQRYLKRHNIHPSDILRRSVDDLTEIVLRETRQGQALEQIEGTAEELKQRLEDLQQVIARADPTVAAMLENTREKMLYQLDKVKSRFVTNHRRTAPSLRRHLNHLLSHLRPLDKPQERVLNFSHFLMDQGPDFLEELMGLIDPGCFSHRVLEL